MNRYSRNSLFALSLFGLGTFLAACGGGGGGSSTPPAPLPPSTGPTSPTSAPSSSASPAATPGASGTISATGLSFANVPVIFTCGCSGEAGEVTTNAGGGYQITDSATPIPASPAPYSPPGHNILVVGYASGSSGQAWTMVYLGTTPAYNLNLSSTPSNLNANVTDTASTAAALYIYYEAAYSTQITGSDRTFDWFNFNQIATFAEHLRTSPSTDETKFLNDISTAQQAGSSLYPGFVPSWNPVASDKTNATITSDIQTVANDGTSVDATLPTPCPGADACTGTPTP